MLGGQVWLRVLGPVEIRDGGAWLRPPRPQLRLLAALLGLSAGRVVPAGDLVDALWESMPPPSARASLQILATRLRKAMTGVPGASVDRYGDGYRLQISPGLVDVHQFRSLVRAARQTADDSQATGILDQALELWRGSALSDVPATAAAEAVRAGLADERLAAIQARFERLIAAGHHAEAAAEIPLVLAGHPLAERLAGMLMIAWSRCGRQADALRVFRDLRGRLIAELGVEPGAELQQLHRQILRGDPVLDRVPAPTPHQLPAAPGHFTGRQRELAALTGWLDAGAGAAGPVLIAISGPPGAGKTALALQWAHRVQHRFPDGQLYVNLHGFGPSPDPVSPAEAISGLLESLGMSVSQDDARVEARASAYRSRLAGKRMLIVLDNARDGAQVRPLLPAGAQCAVLVTSRSELSGLIAAECAQPLRLDVLSEPEARQLLARRIGAGRACAEPRAVSELISLCSRLPLALSIAAARAASRSDFPLTALAAGLRDSHSRLDALDAGDRAADVRAAFSWSYRLLSEPAARMFRLLGAHPGPDIRVAAAASAAAVPAGTARSALRELAAVNLVQEPVLGRFALHDLLRAYAAELSAEDESRSALQRVLDYYLHTARAAVRLVYPADRQVAVSPPRPGAVPEHFRGRDQALAWLRAEHQVLLAATASAAGRGFDAHAWQIPAVLSDYFARRGHYLDRVQSQEQALAAAGRIGDGAAQAAAGRSLGDALIRLGSWQDAERHLRDALRLCRELGDCASQAACHCTLSRLFDAQADHARSLHHAQRALRLYRTAGDRAGQAFALNGVGWDFALLGRNQQALTYCKQALAAHRKLGNRCGEAATLDSLGYCYHQSGHLDQAVAFYQQAISAYADVGDNYHRAHTLIRLGETHRATGNSKTAHALWGEALTILTELRHPDAARAREKLRSQVPAPAGPGGGPSRNAWRLHPLKA